MEDATLVTVRNSKNPTTKEQSMIENENTVSDKLQNQDGHLRTTETEKGKGFQFIKKERKRWKHLSNDKEKVS